MWNLLKKILKLYEIYLFQYNQWLRERKNRIHYIIALEFILLICVAFTGIAINRRVGIMMGIIYIILQIFLYPFSRKTKQIQNENS